MNRRSICTTGISVLLLGALLPFGTAAEPKAKRAGRDRQEHPVPLPREAQAEQAGTDGGYVTRTSGYRPVRQYQGNITLTQAVEIALHQNPDILNAIQEIQRTRGLIIEVRAAALPHIVLTGSFEQQDRRLLRGGGASGITSSAVTSELGRASSANTSTSQSLSESNSGFVGNTNSTGTGVVTGGTEATGSSSSGLGTARAPFHRAASPIGGALAVPPPAVTGTNGTSTAGTTGTDSTSGSSTTTTSSSGTANAISSSNGDDVIQDKSWNVTLEVQQALYTGGQITAAIRIARLSQDSSYYQLRDVVDVIVAQVRQQFYTVLLNRALITVSEEAVRLAQEQLQDQRNRFEAGTVPRFNVLRAEVDVANTQPGLIRARNDYLLAQIQLAKSLGINPGPTGRPEFYCVGNLDVSQRKISLPDALALARARRPALKVQRQAILIDVEQIKVQMAGYKPQLFATAGYELRNRSSSEDLSDVANGWFYGVNGNWNIFDGFSTYGRVKQARARLEQSKISYDDAVRQVDLEVQTAYANLEQARQTIESQQKNVVEALEALRLAQERFAAGAGTQLDILDARVALTRARTTELQARSDFNRDLAEFDRATATQTVYHEGFKDPLEKTERGIFARLAETGLPKIHDSERNSRETQRKQERTGRKTAE